MPDASRSFRCSLQPQAAPKAARIACRPCYLRSARSRLFQKTGRTPAGADIPMVDLATAGHAAPWPKPRQSEPLRLANPINQAHYSGPLLLSIEQNRRRGPLQAWPDPPRRCGTGSLEGLRQEKFKRLPRSASACCALLQLWAALPTVKLNHSYIASGVMRARNTLHLVT